MSTPTTTLSRRRSLGVAAATLAGGAAAALLRPERAGAAAWTVDHLAHRLGVYCGRGSQGSGTTTALGYYDTVASALGYEPAGVNTFSLGENQHPPEAGWARWRWFVDAVLAPDGDERANLGRVLRRREADHFMMSVAPIIGPAFENITLRGYHFGDDPDDTGTVRGVPTSRVERARTIIAAFRDRVADGRDDHHYAYFVDKLVEHGMADRRVTIRLMHEANYPHRFFCALSPPEMPGAVEAAFVAFWRHVVDVMRARATARLGGWPAQWRFDFNQASAVHKLDRMPNRSWADWVETFYPGDAYVDVISFNIYPKSWWPADAVPTVFAELEAMARRHGKPMGLCEFGVDHAKEGDNPAVIARIHAEIVKRPPEAWAHFAYFGALDNFDLFRPELTASRTAFVERFGA
jgi:hypothetical protein